MFYTHRFIQASQIPRGKYDDCPIREETKAQLSNESWKSVFRLRKSLPKTERLTTVNCFSDSKN